MINCSICQSKNVTIYFQSKLPFSLKSDGSVLPTSAQVYRCVDCDHLFKHKAEVEKWNNYDDYHMMENSTGLDKVDFSRSIPQGRSECLISYLKKKNILKEGTSVLDVGCHRGAFLSLLPKGNHAGFDVSKQYAEIIQGLGLKYYLLGESGPQKAYDLVTLIHVFEHLQNFSSDMQFSINALKAEGKILIQVPNIIRQQTDLYVMDHYHHFHQSSIKNAMAMIGLKALEITTDIVNGELTALAVFNEQSQVPISSEKDYDLGIILQSISRGEEALLKLKQNNQKKLIYGSGLYGRLIQKCLGESVVGFIDDNSAIQGKKVNGLLVSSAEDVDKDLMVVIGVPNTAHGTVLEKCKRLHFSEVKSIYY